MPYRLALSTFETSTALVLVFLLLLHLGQKLRSLSNLPPGPPKLPFLGNLHQVSALRPYPQFLSWSQKYGPIFHLCFGSQDIIVLNTREAADELLNNRSRIYSSRTAPHVAQDILSAGQRLVFFSYDKKYKLVRKSLHSALGPGPSKLVRPIQDRESRVVLYDLLMHGDKSVTEGYVLGPNNEVPEGHWYGVIRRYTTSVVLNVMYGQRVHKIVDTPRVWKLYAVLANFVRVVQPGNYMADVFPILRKLPDFLAPWRVAARRLHLWELELYGGYLQELQDKIKKGIKTDCFVDSYLRQRAENGHEDAPGSGLTPDGWQRDKLLAYTAGTVLEAGSDTITAAMQSFILLMVSHPDILKAAMDEIDRAVGVDRMPNWDDEQHLPFVIACIKETLRRRPPLPTGVPHSNDKDDVFNGYHIPKSSTVIPNIWAIHIDPIRYPNPTAFDPSRFMGRDKPMTLGSQDTQDRDHYVFGWGRRFCQGSYLAEASLFIVLSRILWGIDFQPPIDPITGKPILPDFQDEDKTFTEGLVTGVKVFNIEFKPRSEKHAYVGIAGVLYDEVKPSGFSVAAMYVIPLD